jgi:hypothetical protein
MGGKKTKEYKRLPGRKRHAFGYNTLYLGRDHLLLISSRGMSEDYKRFYYRDIQAFITRKTVWGKVQNIVMGVMAAGMGLLTWHVGWEDGGMVLAIFAAFFLIGLTANLLMGPTCVCHIQTAVQREKLPSLNRIRTARRAIDRIKPFIGETQGQVTPEMLAGADFAIGGHLPPTPKPRLRTVSTTYHFLLFGLILAGGVVTAVDVYYNHPALVLAATVLGLVTPALAILALVRQHDSTLNRRLQRVTWAALVYVGLVFLFTSISSTVVAITNPEQSNQVWELIKLRAQLPMAENPWLLGLSIFFIFFAGIVSAFGLLFLGRAGATEAVPGSVSGHTDPKTALG